MNQSQTDENIIKVLGLENLPDEQKIRILEQSVQMVEQRLLLRLMESLTDAKRQALGKIMDRDSKGELDEFIVQEAPNFSDWVVEETLNIKKELEDLGELDE